MQKYFTRKLPTRMILFALSARRAVRFGKDILDGAERCSWDNLDGT